MSCQCFNSIEQNVKFQNSAIETKTLLLSNTLDALLTQIYDASSQLLVCRQFTKIDDVENFCRMPLKTAIGLGAEIDLDSVDFLESVKAFDNSVVMFNSYIQKEENCIYKTKKEMIFDSAKHCVEALELIRETLQIENQFNPDLASRLFIRQTMYGNNSEEISQEVYGKLSTNVKNFIIETNNLISQIDSFFKSMRGIYTLVGDNFFEDKMKVIETCFGTKILSFQSAINLNPRQLHFCLGQNLKGRSKR